MYRTPFQFYVMQAVAIIMKYNTCKNDFVNSILCRIVRD